MSTSLPGSTVSNQPFPSLPGANLSPEEIEKAKSVDSTVTEGDGSGFPSLIEQEQARQEVVIKAAEAKRKLNEELTVEQREKEITYINKHRQDVLSVFGADLLAYTAYRGITNHTALIAELSASTRDPLVRQRLLIIVSILNKACDEILDAPLI